MIDRAPSTDAVGVVLLSGFRNVNCIPLTSSRARRSSICSRARCNGSADVTATACSPLSSASERSSLQYWSAGGTVPKRRHQTSLCEQPHGFLLLEIKDDRSVVTRVDETVHHAVVACRCGRHDTRVATNDEWFAGDVHDHTVATGCHTDRRFGDSTTVSIAVGTVLNAVGTVCIQLEHLDVTLCGKSLAQPFSFCRIAQQSNGRTRPRQPATPSVSG